MAEEQVLDQGVKGNDAGGGDQPFQADPEVEKRARMMGWVDKDGFKGDPERWRPADEFVKRADELMPIMRTQLRKYEDKFSKLTEELTTTRQTVEKVVKMSEKAGKIAYEQAMADITKRQLEAVAAGDTQKWMELEEGKRKVEKPEPIKIEQPAQTTPNVETPEFKAWHVDNDWYLNDPVMTRYAHAYAQENPNPGGPSTFRGWLDGVRSAVAEAFPHKFANPNRGRPAGVDGGAQRGGGAGGGRKKSYNDLPAEAKAQCDKYISSIKGYTREKYVADYFEGE